MLDFDTLVSAQILILAVALTAAFLSGQRRRSLFLLLGATPFGLCVAWGALFEATPKALQERRSCSRTRRWCSAPPVCWRRLS